jgi:uncharacterized SAM-binding protein YcdF (DUF218 family)
LRDGNQRFRVLNRDQLHLRHIIFWIGVIVAVVAIGFVAWAAGPMSLRSAARLWVVSDALDQADLIVVLGGRLDVRPAVAAELYERGIAPRIAVGVSDFDQGLDGRLNRERLLQHGVPSAAIVEFNFRPHSTYGEARGVLEWAKANGVMSVVIPIDIFPARRVRWIFNHELGPTGIRTSVQAVPPQLYSVDDWWQHKVGWTDFRNELIKFTYYRLKY